MILPLVTLCLVLGLQVIILWLKCERLEAKIDSLQETHYADKRELLRDTSNRILQLQKVRPIAEPAMQNPVKPSPSYSADELDNIRDMIKEKLEHAAFTNTPMDERQAAAEVWASLGVVNPPLETI